MASPNDFFVGIVDFFAVLVPGAAAAHVLNETTIVADTIHLPHDGTAQWVVFAVSAYLLGHLIFLAGSRLDRFYDRWRKQAKPTHRDATFKAAERMYLEQYPLIARGDLTTLKWAKAYVRLRAPDAIREIESAEATSKLFRSFTVLFLIMLPAYSSYDFKNAWWIAPACVTLAYLSYHRFRDQRWKSTELAYAYAVLVRDHQQQDAPAQPHSRQHA